MIGSLFILSLILFFVYGKRFFVGDINGKGLFKGKPVILYLLPSLILPIVLLHSILPNHKKITLEENVEIAEKYGDENKILKAYEKHAKSNKNSINAQIRYIDYKFKLNPKFHYFTRELKKQVRDPRKSIKVLEFDESVKAIADLRIGKELNRIITNITTFGAFVNIGIKENGLIHKSNMADTFVENPADYVKLHQRVMEVITL